MVSFIVLLAALIIGFVAHRIGICLVRAVNLLFHKRPSLLLAILCSGLWAGLYAVGAKFAGWPSPFMRFDAHPAFAIGGLVFGFGAGLNQGCSISTLHQLARGKIAMLFTLLGWFLGWYLWMVVANRYPIGIEYPTYPELPEDSLYTLFFVSVVLTLLAIILDASNRILWIGVSVIGMLAALLFYLEPMWAPSLWVLTIGRAITEGGPLPSTLQTGVVLVLMGGMFLSAFQLDLFRLQSPRALKVLRHFAAGSLMGFGGAIALGGNDAQLLMGIPVLSIGAWLAVIFMMLGIVLERTLFLKYRTHRLQR